MNIDCASQRACAAERFTTKTEIIHIVLKFKT